MAQCSPACMGMPAICQAGNAPAGGVKGENAVLCKGAALLLGPASWGPLLLAAACSCSAACTQQVALCQRWLYPGDLT